MIAILTNHSDMGTPDLSKIANYSRKDVVKYLNEKPENAVLVQVFVDCGACTCDVNAQHFMAVFRGAGETLDNFYVQPLPLDNPNDADGGEFTADEALDLALA